jgi:UPF0716 protein FxsA
MFIRLVVLFTLIPLLELIILIRVGTYIGVLNTILIVVVTASVGAYLTKREGLHTLQKMQHNLSIGVVPAEQLFDGFLILTAGLLLLTPGFLTDIVGFSLLISKTRGFLKNRLRRWARRWIEKRSHHNDT